MTGRAHRWGRGVGRWWFRHGPVLAARTAPARRAYGRVAAMGVVVAYLWVGIAAAVGAQALLRAPGPLALLAGAGGGVALGWGARRRRIAALGRDPRGPAAGTGVPAPPRRDVLLVLWAVAIAVGAWGDARL